MPHDDERLDPQLKASLLSPERQAYWDPPRFLARLSLLPGQSILDLGSGPGFWTMALAEAVGPQGRVWALDASRELLDDLEARNPPAQVQLVHSILPKIELPDGSVDFAWAAFVYHEIKPPEKLSVELQRVLKPGGRVAILDWRPDAVEEEGGPPLAERLQPRQIVSWLVEAGLLDARLTWQDNDTYLVEASK